MISLFLVMLVMFNIAYVPVIGYYLVLALKLTDGATLAPGWHIASTTLALSSPVNPTLTLFRSHALNFRRSRNNRVGVQWPLARIILRSDTTPSDGKS